MKKEPTRSQVWQNSNTTCPVCNQMSKTYLFVVNGLPIASCPNCGLVSVNPTLEISSESTNNTYHLPHSKTEHEAAQRYIVLLHKAIGRTGKLLVIAVKNHPFIQLAENLGYELTICTIDELEVGLNDKKIFDACVILYELTKTKDLTSTLENIWTILKNDGLLLLVTSSLSSWPARFFGKQWTEWRPENRFYFSWLSIQLALWRFGFENIAIKPDQRTYNLEHVYQRAITLPDTFLTYSIKLIHAIIPIAFRKIELKLTTSGMIVMAQRKHRRTIPLLSIVVPVYNEAQTFSTLMDSLLKKQLVSLNKEIIIVESNSKDGSREMVLQYANNPEVQIVLQESPQGKGNAVRAGLTQAQGDIVIIQDADLEYDINDYDALLEPLVNFQTAFVLGSRHDNAWKMRQFNDQPGMAMLLNFGHVLFATALNILYQGKMQDPFTMYKVFRRDCLYRLHFECNRFDFDFELVTKLLRKGYDPIEIPVNYSSRSFQEGKKVSVFRDPLTWIKALVKYRFVSPYIQEEK